LIAWQNNYPINNGVNSVKLFRYTYNNGISSLFKNLSTAKEPTADVIIVYGIINLISITRLLTI
jgi:hypothetical protein